MKKLYFTLLALVIVASGAFSQTKLKNYHHTFKPGDEHHFFITNKASEGRAGKDVVWDFSGIEKKGELKSHMYLTSEVDQVGKIPRANIVLEEYGTHFYFRMAGNSMVQYGTITKNGTVIKYDKPFVKMVYPFEYGQSKEGEFSGEILTSQTNKKFTGKYAIQVDGYGKLILPGNIEIEDVVRLKTVKEKTYENSKHTSSVISYKWYCEDLRYPLLTVIKAGTPDKVNTIKTAYYADAKSLVASEREEKENNEGFASLEGDVNAYPNPFSEAFQLDYTLSNKGDVEIIIFDNSGRKVKEIQWKDQPAGNYTKTIQADGNRFSDGLYHIAIRSDQKEIKKTLLKVK